MHQRDSNKQIYGYCDKKLKVILLHAYYIAEADRSLSENTKIRYFVKYFGSKGMCMIKVYSLHATRASLTALTKKIRWCLGQ